MLNEEQKEFLYKVAAEEDKGLRGRDIGMLIGGGITAGSIPVMKAISGSYNPFKWQTGANRNVNTLLKSIEPVVKINNKPVKSAARQKLIRSFEFGRKHPILAGFKNIARVAMPTYLGYSIGKMFEGKE